MHKHLVFSDLDGTLLNYDDYSFEDARDAIDHLKKNDIPLILTTSKTFFEVLQMQQRMGIKAPFIVENGGGIFVPPNHPLNEIKDINSKWMKISNGASYEQLRAFLQKMKKRYPVYGFGDMSHKEVVDFTSLDIESAKGAMKRDFTEPFIMKDTTLMPNLIADARKTGFDIVRGGRFFHLVSANQNKAVMMHRLSKMYGSYYDKPIQTIALGDSQNDFEMIRQADIGVVMPKHDGSFMDMKGNEKVIFAKYPGAKGWNQAVKDIFDVR